MSRRSHSTIEKLPKDTKSDVDEMLIDGVWPEGFGPEDDWTGKPRYIDCVNYCTMKGHSISESAMGRYGKQIKAFTRMRNAGLIARDTMKGLDGENASQTQKAAAEMITAHLIDLVADSENMDALSLKNVAKCARDCAAVSIAADKYQQEQIAKKAKDTAEAIETNYKQFIAPEILKKIKEQIYGIVD